MRRPSLRSLAHGAHLPRVLVVYVSVGVGVLQTADVLQDRLGLLFIVEMWERFSYYGMRALLVPFLVTVAQWPKAEATSLYGTYMMAVYLTPLVGGYIADRWIGTRRSLVIGGAVIASGHFVLVLSSAWAFYVGLSLIVIGTGFFVLFLVAELVHRWVPGGLVLRLLLVIGLGVMAFTWSAVST